MLQAKLLVGAADDPLEREADRVADQVMRTWSSVAASPTAATADPEEAGTARLRRSAASRSDPTSAFEADTSVAQRLSARRGGGQALPASLRARMESGFGADFSGVCIHRDSEAASISTSLSARAFTHGSDIYFGRGAYDPGSRSGQHLLAHELAHVIQQSGPTGLARFPARRTLEQAPSAECQQTRVPATGANHAVLRRVQGPGPLIQRNGPPKQATGLAVDSVIGDFAAEINRQLEEVRTWGDKIPARHAKGVLESLMDYINEQFRSVPVKVLKIKFKGARWGSFSAPEWTMSVGLKPGDKLTQTELREFAVTIYHESRHAEQDFLEARAFAGKRPDLSVEDLRAEYHLPMKQEALELAVRLAQMQGLTKDQQDLVTWLQEDVATREEALDFIRSLATAKTSESEILSQLDTYTPRAWKAGIVNTAYDAAVANVKAVKDHIVAYNRAEPKDLSLVHDTSGDYEIKNLTRFGSAFATNGATRSQFLCAYRGYLEHRRIQAKMALSAAYLAYSVTYPTESDAHSVETVLRHKLGVPPGVGHLDIPNPKDWIKG